MKTLKKQYKQIQKAIEQVAVASNRKADDVLLLAVSKTKPAAMIEQLYQCGQRHFAESYVQEALAKQRLLAAFDISWHFIGPVQSNKTKLIANQFDWVHSVDRLKIARRLSEQRASHLPALNICLQVNISGEQSKSGIALEQLSELVSQVKALPNLRLRGVMAIPEPESDYEKQREPYRKLFQAVADLSEPEMNVFSMGMSADLKAAIAEGSTIVRIGTALFGARQYPDNP